MAWEWSHTAEAYAYARQQVMTMNVETLRVVWAEWRARVADPDNPCSEDGFSQKKYRKAIRRSFTTPIEDMRTTVWEASEAQALCTNGGWEAWVCPWGCHTVPFGPGFEDPGFEDVMTD